MNWATHPELKTVVSTKLLGRVRTAGISCLTEIMFLGIRPKEAHKAQINHMDMWPRVPCHFPRVHWGLFLSSNRWLHGGFPMTDNGGGNNNQVYRWLNTVDWREQKMNCCHNTAPFRDGREHGFTLYDESGTRGGLYQTPCVYHFRSSWALSPDSSFSPYYDKRRYRSFYWLQVNAILQHLNVCLHLGQLASCHKA